MCLRDKTQNTEVLYVKKITGFLRVMEFLKYHRTIKSIPDTVQLWANSWNRRDFCVHHGEKLPRLIYKLCIILC